jgi:hypothetical protein
MKPYIFTCVFCKFKKSASTPLPPLPLPSSFGNKIKIINEKKPLKFSS